jgi:hypothetical protein
MELDDKSYMIGRNGKNKELVKAQATMSRDLGKIADVVFNNFSAKENTLYCEGEELIKQSNLADLLGCLLFDIALAATALGVDLSVIAEANIAKLSARYPEKFGDLGAINRDTEAEHNVLETALSRQEKEAARKEDLIYTNDFFLENESRIINGNLEIRSGMLVLKNCNLRVNGSISVDGDIYLLDSSYIQADNFILSKKGKIESSGDSQINSQTSHIQAHEYIYCRKIMAGTSVCSEKGNIVGFEVTAGFGIQTPNGFLSASRIVVNGKEAIFSRKIEAAQ